MVEVEEDIITPDNLDQVGPLTLITYTGNRSIPIKKDITLVKDDILQVIRTNCNKNRDRACLIVKIYNPHVPLVNSKEFSCYLDWFPSNTIEIYNNPQYALDFNPKD